MQIKISNLSRYYTGLISLSIHNTCRTIEAIYIWKHKEHSTQVVTMTQVTFHLHYAAEVDQLNLRMRRRASNISGLCARSLESISYLQTWVASKKSLSQRSIHEPATALLGLGSESWDHAQHIGHEHAGPHVSVLISVCASFCMHLFHPQAQQSTPNTASVRLELDHSWARDLTFARHMVQFWPMRAD